MKLSSAIPALALLTLSTSALAEGSDKQVCQDKFDAAMSEKREKPVEALASAAVCAQRCGAIAGANWSALATQCAQTITALRDAVPTVVFDAKDSSGASVRAARVSIDGKLAAEALDGKAVMVNPGSHVFRFEVAGQPPKEIAELVKAGEKEKAVVVSFAPAASSQPVPAPQSVAPLASRASSGTPPASASRTPTWAWVAGGAGLVSLGVAAAFGVAALGANSAVNDACGGDAAHCPQSKAAAAQPDADRRSLDRGLFIGFAAAGAVGLAIGLYGVASAPRRTSDANATLVIAPLAGGGGAALLSARY